MRHERQLIIVLGASNFMLGFYTSVALVVALVVMARASHLFAEFEGVGPVQATVKAVGVCAVVLTATSLAILSASHIGLDHAGVLLLRF